MSQTRLPWNRVSFVNIARLFWIIACIAVLIITIFRYSPLPKNDVDVFMAWSMLILTFPAGYVCSFLMGLFYEVYYRIFGQLANEYISTLVGIWLVLFAAGYWQWFYLLPSLVKRFKKQESGHFRK